MSRWSPESRRGLLVAVSLLVYLVVTDASGRQSEAGEMLAAGFESWRTEVWGSAQVRALGADIFPRLAPGELVTVQTHELPQFQRECELIRENLDVICAEVDLTHQHGFTVGTAPGQVIRANASRAVFRDMVAQRLANIEDAISRAVTAGGAVAIW
jgi:hypothetical protein